MDDAKGTFFHNSFNNYSCDKSGLKLHYLLISSLLTPFLLAHIITITQKKKLCIYYLELLVYNISDLII